MRSFGPWSTKRPAWLAVDSCIGEHHVLLIHVPIADLLGTALALGHPDTAGLHEAIGDLHTFLGTYGDALKSYEIAAALASPGVLRGLEHKIGGV